MNYITPEQAGISSKNIKKYIEKLEKGRLSTHNIIMMKGNDIFFEKYLGVYNGSIDVKDLAPRGCRLYWLTPVKEDVALVGATAHIAGIGISLEKNSDNTFTLYAPHFLEMEQKITIVVPEGVKIKSPLTDRVLCDNRQSGIVTVSFIAKEDELVILERE